MTWSASKPADRSVRISVGLPNCRWFVRPVRRILPRKRPDAADSAALAKQHCQMGVSENGVPLNPMVLLIIIPIKWL